MPPKVILIHGLKYSGKSTLATHLIENHGYERVKMATPLKNMIRSLLRDAAIPEERIEDYVEGDLKETPIPELGNNTPRGFMMTLGDEWRNMHGRELWVNIAKTKIINLLREGKSVVVDDIRYDFELAKLAPLNPFYVVVTRGDLHFQPYDDTRHPGERPLEVQGFDRHFKNDGSKEDLWAMADEALATYSQDVAA